MWTLFIDGLTAIGVGGILTFAAAGVIALTNELPLDDYWIS